MPATVKAMSAPTGGWDVKTALADMKEDTATLLDNWFPGVGRVDVRPGYSEYATGLTGDVEMLAEFSSGASRKFLAAANNDIFDISSAGAATSKASAQTITTNRWQTANFDGKMCFVNGTDQPLQYDGTNITTLAITGSGLTDNNLIGVNVFSSRTYFWEDNSQDFWYSAVNTMGGAVTKFPLSRVGQFGGKLLTMGTWTRDGGAGVNDLACFFMTSGEIIVYNGTEPADFNLVGVFRIGAPLSIRGIIKVGGDLIVITKDGYAPLGSVISKGRLGDSGILSDLINPAVTSAAQSFSSNFGWEAFHYPRGNMLIFNIPITTNTTYNQHVFNTHTGAACRFKNINSRTWGLYNDRAYFGGSGSVYLFDDTLADNTNVIDCDCITANTYLGSKARQKLITGVQLSTASDGPLALALKTESGYAEPVIGYNTATFVGGESAWDTATWDTGPWASGTHVINDWESSGAFGYSFRTRVKLRISNQRAKWYSINYMYEKAGLV